MITGQVSRKGKPQAGVTVSVYPDAHATLRGPAAYVSQPTAPDGRYRVDVPAGVYFVLARHGDADECLAFPGGNPMTVLTGQEARAQLVLVEGQAPAARRLLPAAPGATGIRGVTLDGTAGLPDAWVMAYADTAQGFRGPGIAQGVSDRRGRFLLELPPGTYFLLARKRLHGGRTGPLVDGDHLGYFHGNPVTVTEGQVVDVALPTYRLPKRPRDHLPAQTVITGTLVDASGRPVRGAFVLALTGWDGSPPVAASPGTGRDGRFTLRLTRGGRYHLLARGAVGGPPGQGELLGRYDDGEGVVELPDGQTLSGLKLVMKPAD